MPRYNYVIAYTIILKCECLFFTHNCFFIYIWWKFTTNFLQ